MSEFLTFQRFDQQEMADDLIEILRSEFIAYEVESDRSTFDATLAVERPLEISVKIRQEDFEKANKILLERAAVNPDNVPQDYYLLEFTDEELVDLISRPDEWSHYDYSLALQLLKKRGKEIHPELAATLRKNRVKELSRPETGTKSWIVLGYALALMGGLLGIFMGIHMATNKKVLPNGDKVYSFAESDRKHGFAITIIGLAVIVFVLIAEIIIAVRY